MTTDLLPVFLGAFGLGAVLVAFILLAKFIPSHNPLRRSELGRVGMVLEPAGKGHYKMVSPWLTDRSKRQPAQAEKRDFGDLLAMDAATRETLRDLLTLSLEDPEALRDLLRERHRRDREAKPCTSP